MPDEIFLKAEERIGYQFNDHELLCEALTHASVAEHRLVSNERMEFLGDAILGCVVCEHLFHNYPEYLEGDLTKIKSAVVSRRVCAELAEQLQLPELLSLGKGMEGRQQLPASLAAAVFESLVAAIYLDGGIEPTREFILRHLKPVIDEAANSAHQQNYKSVLQQYAQKNLSELPVYRLLGERGPDHSKSFHMAAEIAGRCYPPAWGSNKKQAEQEAALNALREMNLVSDENDGTVTLVDDI